MPNRTLKLFAAAVLIVTSPALADAQIVAYSTSSPILLTSFSAEELYAPGSIGGEATESPQFTSKLDSGYIALKFVNKSNVPATTVKFVLNNGRYTRSIVDEGTFSPGTQIKHSFAVESGLSELSNATCKVAEVDFADGSAWHNVEGDADNR